MSVEAVRQRVGWLLRVNRRLGADEDLRVGITFARAFSPGGATSNAASVSRWESGSTAISTATVERYEALLGLRRGSLTALKFAAERALGAASAPGATRVEDEQRLHVLLDRATSGDRMSGRQWLDLSQHVQAAPDLRLHPPGLWDELTHRLLSELVVAEHGGWLQRQEAMSRLLEHRWAGAPAVRACIDLVEDDTTPAVIEPLSLLEASPDPGANRYVRQTIETTGSERALFGALLAASRKISHRHFSAQDSRRIGNAVTSLLKDTTLDEGLRRLALEVAVGLRTGRAPTTAEAPAWTTNLRPRRIATRACARTAPAGPDSDDMLTELVGEALYNPNPDERMLAAMLIAGTPFREAVSSCLLVEVLLPAGRGEGRPTEATRHRAGRSVADDDAARGGKPS